MLGLWLLQTTEARCLLQGVCITSSIAGTVTAGEFNSLNPTVVPSSPPVVEVNGSGLLMAGLLCKAEFAITPSTQESKKLFLLLLSLKFKHNRSVFCLLNFCFISPCPLCLLIAKI